MFSSPAFRVFHSENAESMAQRKPGNALISRKPFLDKTINCKTPDTNRKQKPILNIPNEPVKVPSPVKTPTLELNPEDFFSYKEVPDQYEDILPNYKRLETEHVFNILKNYLNDNTPPPSPKEFNIPLDVPMEQEHFSSSFDEDMFFGLPKMEQFELKPMEEADLSMFDFDDM